MTIAEHFVELSTGRSRYLRGGEGPPLMLLHGMGITSSAESWMFVHEPLAEHFDVVAVDLLGYGKGDRNITEGPTFELTVDHLRELMDVVGIERASVVGHSAGGWAAGLLAYESPDRVEDLVLLCFAGLNERIMDGILGQSVPDRDEASERVRAFLLDPASADPRLELLADVMYEMGQQRGALTSLDAIIHQMSTLDLRRRYLLHRRMPFIRSRTLMAWGRGDVMDPFPTWTGEFDELGGAMEKSAKPWVVPGAEFALLPTGHAAQWEQPELLVDVLLKFLRR